MQCFDIKFLRFCLFYKHIETSQTVLCHTTKWVNDEGERRKEEEERRNSINTIYYINKTNKNKKE